MNFWGGQFFFLLVRSMNLQARFRQCVHHVSLKPQSVLFANYKQLWCFCWPLLLQCLVKIQGNKSPRHRKLASRSDEEPGVLAWGEDGSGFVLQVTTPDWPGAGGGCWVDAGLESRRIKASPLQLKSKLLVATHHTTPLYFCYLFS